VREVWSAFARRFVRLDVSATSTVRQLEAAAAPTLRAPARCVTLAAPAEDATAAAAASNAADAAITAANAAAIAAATGAWSGLRAFEPAATALDARLFQRRSDLRFLVDPACVEATQAAEAAAAGTEVEEAVAAAAAAAVPAETRAEQKGAALAKAHGRRW
jgi:hypothetical protein